MRKKNKRIAGLVLLLSLVLWGASAAPREPARVKFVFDGDTVLMADGEKVRYLGIDTPEIDYATGKSEFLAQKAKAFNRSMVQGVVVFLEYDRVRTDAHGRTLAYVFLKDGTLLNALLVRKGLARLMLFSTDLKYMSLLLDSQRRAMRDKIGLWARGPEHKGTYYIGSRKSYRFHRPSCPFGKRIAPRNRVRFPTRFEAFWEGYSPCRRCRP